MLEAGDEFAAGVASGGTCVCSRRGASASTSWPGACSRRRAGWSRPATSIRPAQSSASATWCRSPNCRPRRPDPHRARVVAVTRRATDKMKDAGREQAPFELVVATARGSSASTRPCGDRCQRGPVGAQPARVRRRPGQRREAFADRIAYAAFTDVVWLVPQLGIDAWNPSGASALGNVVDAAVAVAQQRSWLLRFFDRYVRR